MAPPESATVTDLAAARDRRARGAGTKAASAATPGASAPAATTRTTAEKKGGRKPANRRFDTEKVERLKAAIAEGRYVIDAASVADRFIEHERNG